MQFHYELDFEQGFVCSVKNMKIIITMEIDLIGWLVN